MTKEDSQYEVGDLLSGTGIDLRAEEQYLTELYSNTFDTNTEARTGFAQQPAGPRNTFYGAGPANQAVQPLAGQDQDAFTREAAEKAWSDSATRLAVQRTQEVKDPFLLIAMLHRRADKVAREHSIGLNLEYKNNAPNVGKMKLPEQFPSPSVTVKVKPGPDSTMVQTTGSFVPHDAYLADQLALMSIASKHRLRELLEDASVVAGNRQKTSHGDVPDEWVEAAAPMNQEPLGEAAEGAVDAVNGATSPGTNPLKRK